MDNMVEFAKRMKARREELGLTQAQLGEMAGVSAQTISAYEKNISGNKGKTPTLDTAINIAKVLKVSLDHLCGNSLPGSDHSITIDSLRDIAEYLTRISRYVRCYGNVKERRLTDDEYQEVNGGLPEEYATATVPMAVFTIDNSTLAEYFKTRNRILALYRDGAINEDIFQQIVDGQLARLQDYKVSEKTTWFPGGIDDTENLPK